MSLAVVILTFNEQKHIERCIESALQVASRVYVVDSFSTDRTVELSESLGARVFQHEFKNHAAQLEWALANLPFETDWVMRVDADEVISPELAAEIRAALPHASASTDGFTVPLCVRFQGALIRHGGYPQHQLRIWRSGQARIEARWMDEKILVLGEVGHLHGRYLDDNLNNLAWWTDKHNRYSTREAIDLLNKKYAFLAVASESGNLKGQARTARWLKENVYLRLPPGLRAWMFFVYRMIFRLGLLDGKSGFAFHFLQGFWYRFLADAKVREVERRMQRENISCVDAIRREFGIDPGP